MEANGDGARPPVKFRNNVAIAIAGLIGLFGAIPFAAARWYFAPILLVPLAVLVWGWRAGTDADAEGVAVRAVLGRRRWTWAQISGFVPQNRRVHAVLTDGATVPLPAVRPSDLPRLVAASGTELSTRPGPD